MKAIRLTFFLFLIGISLLSCDAIQKASNTTGGVFSLNGQWELISNTPENTLIGSRVTVAPIISEARFSLLANNTQCFRETDVKWKEIKSDGRGGFTLSNLLSACNNSSLNYQPAVIAVVNANEVRLTGKNISGIDNTQTWKRIAQ